MCVYCSVLGMHSTGIISFLKRRHFRYLEERACEAFVHTTSEAIRLQKTWPLFAITGALLTVASAVLIVERLYGAQFRVLGP